MTFRVVAPPSKGTRSGEAVDPQERTGRVLRTLKLTWVNFLKPEVNNLGE